MKKDNRTDDHEGNIDRLYRVAALIQKLVVIE